jgi:hypothetical protein
MPPRRRCDGEQGGCCSAITFKIKLGVGLLSSSRPFSSGLSQGQLSRTRSPRRRTARQRAALGDRRRESRVAEALLHQALLTRPALGPAHVSSLSLSLSAGTASLSLASAKQDGCAKV